MGWVRVEAGVPAAGARERARAVELDRGQVLAQARELAAMAPAVAAEVTARDRALVPGLAVGQGAAVGRADREVDPDLAAVVARAQGVGLAAPEEKELQGDG